MASIYKIHHVDTDDPTAVAFLAGKLAALKLRALNTSPEAFGGQIALEAFSQIPHDQWIERLLRPNFHTFVAIAYPENTPEEFQTATRGNIVGSATLIGPIPKSSYEFSSVNQSKVGDDNEETKWHCTALFCAPEHRGKGLGRLLVTSRVAFANANSPTEKLRIRVLVHPHNTEKVLEPLQARGFMNKGECTPAQAIFAGGDQDLLRPDVVEKDPEMFRAPIVSVLELETTKS